MTTHWLITDKGDSDCRRLVDGEFDGGQKPHYSRQTVGARMFTRNGQNLVFTTSDRRAVWVTFRPTPGIAFRPDKLDCWENALFRNESNILSSTLIREAVELSCALWGEWPKDGFITFIKPNATRCPIVGYCYRRAGWRRWGASSDGKPRFKAPRPSTIRSWKEWNWKDNRGGKLRAIIDPFSFHCSGDTTMTKISAPIADAPKTPMSPEKRARYLARWSATLRGLQSEYDALIGELTTAATADLVRPLVARLHANHAEQNAAQAAIKRYTDNGTAPGA